MAAAKRQNIILGIAILALIYGLYDVLVLPRPKKGEPQGGGKHSGELQSFIMQVASDIKSMQSDFGAYIANAAEKPWVRNPFFAPAKAPGSARHGGFSYTGYLAAGGRGIAIVNQVEYQVGDELENRAGYFVKEITPARVVIENRPAKTEIAVPLHD